MTNNNINGLVLAGGKSLRMGGADKGETNWHGKEQRFYLADILKLYCNDVYISCRQEQTINFPDKYRPLYDTFEGGGPICGILSAFKLMPEKAWMIVACDLPLINDSIINQLVSDRNQLKLATTFKSPFDGLPEPLITIWEPKSFPKLLESYNNGRKCPRKVLLNNDIELLIPKKPASLLNVNTPEDIKIAMILMGKQANDY